MDWWNQLGNYVTMFGSTPALAADMALSGPNANHLGYDLAYGLTMAPTPIDVYPSEDSFAGAEG